MSARPSFNLIDLFSGVGGFTVGFADRTDEPPYAIIPRLMVDIDQEARAVATRNMPSVPFVSRDIRALTGNEIRAAARLGEKDVVHILVGGPPCQGFSHLGRRALDDSRNILLVDYLRAVKELRPCAVVLENVPLMITSHGGVVINEVCELLSVLGYSSVYDTLLASDFGVPQYRRRAILIAYRGDLGVLPRLPKASHEHIDTAIALMDNRERRRLDPLKRPYISVEEAIGDLPALSAGEGEDLMFYTGKPMNEYQQWARAGSLALYNHRSRAHNAEFLKTKLSLIVEGGRNQELPDAQRFSDSYYSQAYARLHRHGIAQTITTHFANPGSGRFTHYRELRSITVREAARFQSFPDRFAFDGTLSTQMRHVGNAVPPILARALRAVIGEDLVAAGVYLESRPVGRPRRVHSIAETAERSRVMRAVPSKNSSSELALRKALTVASVTGYRLHRSDVFGSPDIVFLKQRLAVFVDGCFWHGCPECYRAPKENAEYWTMKVRRNRERDVEVSDRLAGDGWEVLRFWEHEVMARATACASRIKKTLVSRNAAATKAQKRLKKKRPSRV